MIPTSSSIRHRLAQLATDLPDTPVRQVMVGVHMTAVASKTVGCAYTFRDPVGAAHLCAEIRGAGSFRGSSAKALARYAESDAFLERSIGLASINSLLNTEQIEYQHGDILRLMKRRFSGATIGMIGHFPFAPEIKEWAGTFKVIEKRPIEDDLPAEAGWDYLRTCDAVIITGVTLLNDTLPPVLRAAEKAWKLMLGPTVPMHPLLLDLGVDALTGIICAHEEQYWRELEEGAIVPRFRGSKPVVLSRERLELPAGDFRERLCTLIDQTTTTMKSLETHP